ncbi:MAG: Lpg1974 family pore-forming outer membrane protein [Gemmataceae bacterium]
MAMGFLKSFRIVRFPAGMLGCLTWIALAGPSLSGGGNALIAADPPAVMVSDPNAPIAFKDLTPPALHGGGEGHGMAHGVIQEHGAHGAAEEGGFYGSAEYLLMRPRRGLMDYAIRDPNNNLVPEGDVLSLNYKLRSGVRAGIGYRVPESAWDFQTNYTFFESRAGADAFAPAGGTLYATLTRPTLNDNVTSASARAGLEYNVWDAVIGRRIVIDERASIRPYAGLSWAIIRQTLDVSYNGGQANQGQVNANSFFNGFGPIVGVEGQFNITEHWNLYARGQGGLFTGTVRNPLLETNNAGLTTYANLNFNTRKVVPMASLAIAGGWQSGRVTIRAGYEVTNWFGLIDQPRLTGELSEGKVVTRSTDLSLEGLFVYFGLTF